VGLACSTGPAAGGPSAGQPPTTAPTAARPPASSGSLAVIVLVVDRQSVGMNGGGSAAVSYPRTPSRCGMMTRWANHSQRSFSTAILK
jgi:hypothetical protein